MVFDGHSDLLYDVMRRRLAGEHRVLERRHLKNLQRGGIEGMMLSIWAHPDGQQTYREYTEQMMDAARSEFEESPWLKVVSTAAEAKRVAESGKCYAFLCVEGMAAVGEDLSYIDRYAAFGARAGMLTWNEENTLATGAGGDAKKGLTALGKQAVQRMQKLGMLVDVSHLNEGGFWDVIDLAEGPVIASHSNCRSLCNVPRNLKDDQLRAIRDTGGVVGINVHHGFAHAEPAKQTVEMLARHAVHMVEIMGIEHVACGFDFCEYFGPGNEGVQGMEDCSRTPNFFAELKKLGMTNGEMQLIARENFLRIL